ncbi:hypothetical protein CPU12_02545 [Malaciobacter molluscorum LMG 25693]|uniref:Uncharacterized protein n=1 Tax=Malaciobacter molluscorum LMG 25693 TaxID=870501 RepID=A0A2G1DKZ0_9BACT|nr:hypothetical protein [Malaciobacter molluscorum]AXX92727.1 hypothetical protein AMOL_1762 [Malaciobacter molluscorum LMG 25693]PHO19141.1 hypothetical protein CPU12_02545 [Malaciobacter molluscorum LMG 25693]
MKINTENNYLYNNQYTQKSSNLSNDESSFSSVLAATTAESSTNDQVDFTNMSRQEMFDWMNNQIRNGKLSLDDSSAFLGMTMKVSVSGHPVDMSTDATRINFIEKARLGAENALSSNDLDLAKRLQIAIEIMNRQKN